MANASASVLLRVLRELEELEGALAIAPVQTFSSEEAGGRTLRQVLELAAAKVAHELTRFTLVVRATTAITAADIAEVAILVQEAAATFTSAVQLYTAEGACGRTLRKEVRENAKCLLRTTREAVAPVAPTPVAGASLTDAMVMANRGRAGGTVLTMTGLVQKLADAVPKLSASDVNAVRSVVLNVAKLLKTSISEVAEDHQLRPGDVDGPAAPAAAPAGEDDDDDEEDDEDDQGSDAGSLTAEQQEAIVRAGLRALSSTQKAVRAVFMVVEAVARAPASGGSEGALVAAAGGPAPLAPGAPSAPVHPHLDFLDDLAALMATAEEAVIDVAAAVNDVETDAIPDAVRDLEGVLNGLDRRLSASLRAGADGAAAEVAVPWSAPAAEFKTSAAAALEVLAGLRRAAGAARA